jgi:hypothetical protein
LTTYDQSDLHFAFWVAYLGVNLDLPPHLHARRIGSSLSLPQSGAIRDFSASFLDFLRRCKIILKGEAATYIQTRAASKAF